MKTTLTIEQSAELIKRGVTLNENNLEVFDISALLSRLPKVIQYKGKTHCTLSIRADSTGWQTFYFNSKLDIDIGWARATELIDSLYMTLCSLIDHNYIKFN